MDKSRSRFAKWIAPTRTQVKSLTRTKSVFTKCTSLSRGNADFLMEKKKCMSLDRVESVESSKTNSELLQLSNRRQIYSSLQPEIYASLDSSSSDMDLQSNCSGNSFSQQDLINITNELILRTDTVTRGFEILEIIYLEALKTFKEGTEKYKITERIFKDLRCMSSFHRLYQNELSSVFKNELQLSMVFTNQVINSALNWYKIFYTTFEVRNQLLNSFYHQDFQFKMIADKAIVLYTQKHSKFHVISVPWILSSIKDSLFHFKVLLTRYSECLDDNLERFRITDAINLIQNILRSCNMQCDYNDFMKTQHEYNALSPTDPLGPSVRFVHKGLVQKVCRQNSSVRQRMIFLFTHMIFITNKSIQFHTYRIKHKLHLSLCNFSILSSDINSVPRKGFRLESGDFVCEFLIEKENDFYMWIEKLNFTICQAKLRKNSFDRKISKFLSHDEGIEDPNTNIGYEEPNWQQPTNTNFCNGYYCPTRFGTNQKRKHCTADGLLYCEDCLIYSAFIAYSNNYAVTCKECFEIITNHDDQINATERQILKKKRILRDGMIKGWLTINKLSSSLMNLVESRQKMFCVLSSDCTIYTYELPDDKYHQLPIRVQTATFASPTNETDNSMFSVVSIQKNGTKYSIEADSQEEALRWIQSIKFCQLENLQSF